MLPIQFILILGLFTSLGVYFYGLRSTLCDRALALGLLFTGIVAILFPDHTSILAQHLGVGRGSDLVMYFFFVAAIFLGVILFSKLHGMERRQTEVVRALALWKARSAERD